MVKVIPGFSRYRIDSETLEIRNGSEHPIAVQEKGGYLTVELMNDLGQRKCRGLHVFVAETFIGPKPGPEFEVCHDDGNPKNCAPGNLLYGTKKLNGYHRAHVHFTSLPGEKNPDARLNEKQVRIIFYIGLLGTLTTAETAKFFPVSDETIRKIWRRRAWCTVTAHIFGCVPRLCPQRGRRNVE